MGRRTGFVLGFAVALAALIPITARAEWLVTTEGQAIETLGAWKIRSNVAHFTLPDGTYSVLPGSSIDLEASRRMTKAARRPTAEPVPVATETRESVLRLTDDDVAHAPTRLPVERDTTSSVTSSRRQSKPGRGPSATGERLRVLDWEAEPQAADGSLVVVGHLQNASRQVTGNVELNATLVDADGAVTNVRAQLSASTLMPGQKARFRAEFDTLHDYDKIEFSFVSDAIDTAPE